MNTISNDIVNEWGLKTLPKETQVEMIDRIGRVIFQAVLVKSLDILTSNEQIELDSLMDQDNSTPESVMEFLATKIPTFNQLLLEERQSLKHDILIPVV